MFCLYTLPIARPAQAKVQMLTTSSCVVKSIPWNLVNLSHLYFWNPIRDIFTQYVSWGSKVSDKIRNTNCLHDIFVNIDGANGNNKITRKQDKTTITHRFKILPWYCPRSSLKAANLLILNIKCDKTRVWREGSVWNINKFAADSQKTHNRHSVSGNTKGDAKVLSKYTAYFYKKKNVEITNQTDFW